MQTIRQTCGLSGFPKRDESVHDAFGVGHSSTSISAALGTYIYILIFCLAMILSLNDSLVGEAPDFLHQSLTSNYT